MNVTHYVLMGLAFLLLLISLLPLIRSDYWTFRVFDFPRAQKLVLSAVVLLSMISLHPGTLYYTVTEGLLAANCVYLGFQVLPYTPLSRRQVKGVKSVAEIQCLSLVVANVLQENTDHDGCLTMLKKADPDIILLLETNSRWQDALSPLKEAYPHRILVPQENTYGMLFYSRLPVKHPEIRFMVENDIPSIHCQVQLRNGQCVRLYCLHPTPPVPGENPRSTERDKELLLTASLSKKETLPVLVIGDLNDVAWSYTTELFLKMSGLLDPRKGRGFYNTFNARYKLLRFPLDHVFVSPHFKLVNLRRLDNFHSDHFPIYGKYPLEKTAPLEQETMQPDESDIQAAREKMRAI